MAKAKMHLGFDFSYTHMGGRWRLPGAWPGRTFPDVAMFEDMARTAERGLFDILFSGDGTGVPDTWRGSRDAAVEWGVNWPRQDLNPIMVAMSRVTKHIGYGLTYSSTFMHPYYTARLMNSLDHLTGGRIAMNLVASTRRVRLRQFRLRRAHRPQRPLRADGGVHRRLPQALGRHRSRRHAVGPRHRPRRRPGQGPRHAPRGPLLQGRGPAQHPALPTRPPGPHPGRRLAPRHPRLRLRRRPRLRRRHGAAPAGQAAPRARRRADRTRPRPGASRHPLADAHRRPRNRRRGQRRPRPAC